MIARNNSRVGKSYGTYNNTCAIDRRSVSERLLQPVELNEIPHTRENSPPISLFEFRVSTVEG